MKQLHIICRNNSDFITLARRTEIYSKSVIPSSLKLWNELDDDTRNIPTLGSFKSRLKETIKPPVVPTFYLSGDRREQIYHARIRNGCSNLNSDLHHNHISDSPECDCGNIIENATHYFFQCPRFSNQRLELFFNTQAYYPLTTKKLLFGIENLTNDDNSILFSEVQKFIKQ